MSATPSFAPPPLRHEEIEDCTVIIQAVDCKARELERRWGTGRLPNLVPVEWAERFMSQRRKFSAACFALDLEQVRLHGTAMERAYDKLEELATASGHMPTPPEHWEFQLEDGQLVVLVRDRAEMVQIDLKGRQAQIWSLDEIAEIVRKFPMLSAAKESFPGAEVISIRPERLAKDALDDALGDIPF